MGPQHEVNSDGVDFMLRDENKYINLNSRLLNRFEKREGYRLCRLGLYDSYVGRVPADLAGIQPADENRSSIWSSRGSLASNY